MCFWIENVLKKHHKGINNVLNMQKILHINIQEKILNSEECGELLGLSKRNIEEKFRNGEIPAHKRNGKWYVLMSELVEYIREGEEK